MSNSTFTAFAQDRDGCGVFSRSLFYGRFECYKHLSGDLSYVAESQVTGERHFYRTCDEMVAFVESQPQSATTLRLRPDAYTWRVSRD